MYYDNPSFEKPENEDTKIWRFIDFTKYVNLLDTKSLYFNRADLFDNDLFEGTYSRATVKALKRKFEKLGLHHLAKSGLSPHIDEYLLKAYYLNCWHINEYESDAMWKLYATYNKGVAIQSTFRRLKRSFIDTKDVSIGKVKYIDYNKEIIPMDNDAIRLFRKRLSYRHEEELRAIASQYPSMSGDITIFDSNPKGLYIQVNLDELIEKISVSPRAKKWFSEQVISISAKYGLNKPIEMSALSERPLR